MSRAPCPATQRAASAIAAGSRPGELHRGAVLVEPELGAGARLGPGAQHLAGGDHLRDHQPGAEPDREVAEGHVGDAGHRCEKNGRIEGYAPQSNIHVPKP